MAKPKIRESFISTDNHATACNREPKKLTNEFMSTRMQSKQAFLHKLRFTFGTLYTGNITFLRTHSTAFSCPAISKVIKKISSKCNVIKTYVHSSVTIPCCWSSRPGKFTTNNHCPLTLNATLGCMKCVLVGHTLLLVPLRSRERFERERPNL